MECVDHWLTDERAVRALTRWYHEDGGSFDRGLDEHRRRASLAAWLRRRIEARVLSVAELHPPPPLPPAPRAAIDPPRRPAAPDVDGVEDVFLLVAEVRLLGDTPLIRHAVRILDPDTGDAVAEAETDEHGVVHAEVPAHKTYRLEIVDRAIDVPSWETIDVPHAVLRCRLVDPTGAPVPHLDVTVRDLDGHPIEVAADEDGLLEMPASLGLYQVIVGDRVHWVHALLPRDTGDTYEIVVDVEDDETGPPSVDRLARFTRDDDIDDAFDDVFDDTDDDDQGEYA